MVKEEWRGLGEVHFLEKMKALTTPLRKWHKQHFGDITEKIKRFEEEIKKVDDMVSSGRYDDTMEAKRRALVRCCEKWYVRQDVHWKQMFRSRHASEMDRNTRYFHNIASARRRNNRIETLEDSPNVSFRDGLVNRLGREEAETLEVLPSVDEVKETVWDCESSKALERDSNVTWVALAPKFIGVKEIKDLRPISMVGCVYKVISKLLTRRMKSVMPGLVGESQSAFVKRRKIHNGALIALLETIGFGRTWRSWIKECVRTASMSILVNGSPSKPVRMERGLCQGDPLSPFLFVLVVDVLNRMIGEAVRNGRISPLLVGRDNIELSHLQFADDTILFCPPDEVS
ncbi:uncharacterized protein LOC130961174 [Arachis stenosperma]|uniref:uncharacterized protein LOC130961174 n=1 Tax=Arachis stenosperma TaxID=217475 RepID=UPI0025ABECC8|nr:uncharacterized protein LOC130961174 [Arachis stenosperma]